MNKIITLLGIFTLCITATAAFGQEKAKEIRKEVRMEEKDGVKTLIITTTTDGKVSEETYTGEEAEEKLSEMMEGRKESDEIKKEIEVEMIDGEKKVTITTSRNGKIKKEIFVGEEAEKKLKEIESAEPKKAESQTNTIKKTESVIIDNK